MTASQSADLSPLKVVTSSLLSSPPAQPSTTGLVRVTAASSNKEGRWAAAGWSGVTRILSPALLGLTTSLTTCEVCVLLLLRWLRVAAASVKVTRSIFLELRRAETGWHWVGGAGWARPPPLHLGTTLTCTLENRGKGSAEFSHCTHCSRVIKISRDRLQFVPLSLVGRSAL